jgi:hypothetical protein
MWFVNQKTIPPKDTPVTLTIKLEPAGDPAKDTKKEPAK